MTYRLKLVTEIVASNVFKFTLQYVCTKPTFYRQSQILGNIFPHISLSNKYGYMYSVIILLQCQLNNKIHNKDMNITLIPISSDNKHNIT